MTFIRLDDYSIGEIFSMLDLRDHQCLACTCKTMQAISKRSFNMVTFKRNLQSNLIRTMFKLHNRSDVPGNMERQYRINFMLKAFKQIITASYYMNMVPVINTRCTQDTDKIVIDALIRKSLVSTQNNGLAFLCNLAFHSRITLNYWYIFELDHGAYVYMCNVRHPEFEVERRDNGCDVVIGIYYENEKDPAFYCCNVSKFDWFVSELSSSEFSTSCTVLTPVCNHLKKLFPNKDFRRLITPNILQTFTLSNYHQHAHSFESCLKDTQPKDIEDVHEINTTSNSQEKGLNNRVNILVDQDDAVNENSDAVDLIFTNSDSELSMFKSVSLRNILTIFNKYNDTNDLSMLSGNLQYYCNFCCDEKNLNSCFIDSLACFVRICTKTLAVFDYGELLPYKPVVRVLLENVILDEKVLEKNREVVCVLLRNKRVNRIEVIVEQKRRSFLYEFKYNNEVLFRLNKAEESIVSPRREVAMATRNLLLREFEEFLVCNFDDELILNIPVVSLSFVFTFLDVLFLQPLCDIATIRETFFNVW